VKHIDNTVSKANRTMGFIRRNLRDYTKPVKAAAYTTMARLTLEYEPTVWDSHSSAETLLNTLQVLNPTPEFL
jgi:hypothetical protein